MNHTQSRAPTHLPSLGQGRVSLERRTAYEAEMRAFRRWMEQIKESLGFAPVSRSWLYLMEDAHIITKGDFNKATAWLAKARKTLNTNGVPLIPLHLVAADDTRALGGVDVFDKEETPREYINRLIRNLSDRAKQYWPASFWKFQDYYPIVWVEKRDLLKLFEPVLPQAVKRFAGKGWADINSRAACLREVAWARDHDLEPVILYCGDLDPVGVAISDHIRNNLAPIAEVLAAEDLLHDYSVDDLEIIRFGLEAEFIEENHLLWIDGLETSGGRDLADPGHPDHHKPHVQSYLRQYGARKVEANALITRPEAAQELMEEALAPFLDDDGIDRWEEENRLASQEATQHTEHFIKMLTFLDAQGWLYSGAKLSAAAEHHRQRQQPQLPDAIDTEAIAD
ncbi:MAG: hypothetical protein VKI42_03085 [Synechococcaceae cyanobacterium]|nr:hypothetical protein [Synechococcaceae cyanobacterium]